MYQQLLNFDNTIANCVRRLVDGAIIPFDPANTDAFEFAKWLQEGNKPEPAEEGGVVTDEWVADTIAKLLP
jgi:cytochrome c